MPKFHSLTFVIVFLRVPIAAEKLRFVTDPLERKARMKSRFEKSRLEKSHAQSSCRSIASAAAVSLLALLLNGCSRLTTVQDVQTHPHRWLSTVQLQGTVGDRVPLIGAEVYELKDETGTIWVLTRDRRLKTGQQVKIEGKIQIEAIEIAGQTTQEVYIEQQSLINSQP